MGRKVAFMADILDKTGVVISNRQLSDRLWIIDIKVDALGADLMPGQFVHMLIPGMEGHILRRPFSVFYVSEDGTFDSVLQLPHVARPSGCWFRQQASDNGRSRYGC